MLWLYIYIALVRTPTTDCYWVGAVPKIEQSDPSESSDLTLSPAPRGVKGPIWDLPQTLVRIMGGRPLELTVMALHLGVMGFCVCG